MTGKLHVRRNERELGGVALLRFALQRSCLSFADTKRTLDWVA